MRLARLRACALVSTSPNSVSSGSPSSICWRRLEIERVRALPQGFLHGPNKVCCIEVAPSNAYRYARRNSTMSRV